MPQNVGLDVARSITPIKDELDIDAVVQAIRTVHAGAKPLIDEAQATAIRQDFSRQLREKREAEHHALAAKNQKAVTRSWPNTPSKRGSRPPPRACNTRCCAKAKAPSP